MNEKDPSVIIKFLQPIFKIFFLTFFNFQYSHTFYFFSYRTLLLHLTTLNTSISVQELRPKSHPQSPPLHLTHLPHPSIDLHLHSLGSHQPINHHLPLSLFFLSLSLFHLLLSSIPISVRFFSHSSQNQPPATGPFIHLSSSL